MCVVLDFIIFKEINEKYEKKNTKPELKIIIIIQDGNFFPALTLTQVRRVSKLCPCVSFSP